ncbi:hypothetical protein VAWG001_00670 [Aeromonas dhakensis]|nr:hypothetical protein VAWG001_00670 [Aeromonas dhakensis]
MRLFMSAGFCGCIALGMGRPAGVTEVDGVAGAGGSLAQPASSKVTSSGNPRTTTEGENRDMIIKASGTETVPDLYQASKWSLIVED